MNNTSQKQKYTKPLFKLAQLSDCHLFASTRGLHHGANVYQNLLATLKAIAKSDVNYVVFTGDLTQDHSEASYQLFHQAVQFSGLNKPFYFLAGNHDEHALLNKYLVSTPFNSTKVIEHGHWKINLLNSKSDTPAGVVDEASLQQINQYSSAATFQFLMMHHHPIDVGYFIDNHGLKNKLQFWQTVTKANNVKGIACGHVHNAIQLTADLSTELKQTSNQHSTEPVVLYTCPATSVAFDKHIKAKAINCGPSYQTFTFSDSGNITCDVVDLGQLSYQQ